MSDLPFAPACERNKDPIAQAMLPRLPRRGRVVEIGSGTAQHVVHFAPLTPALQWQPTDRVQNLAGIEARIAAEGSSNIKPALALDVITGPWPGGLYQAVFSANTAHIMSWQAVCALFLGVGRKLEADGSFFLYGPFCYHGRHTASSNQAFDIDLRRQSPSMGVRDLRQLQPLAAFAGLSLHDDLDLPANNRLLIFRKAPD